VQILEEGGKAPIRLKAFDGANGDLAALAVSVVAGAGVYQPDTNGRAIFDCTVRHLSAITARRFGFGFMGLVPVGVTDFATIATTTATLNDDDGAMVVMDSAAGDADRLYVLNVKGNAADSIANLEAANIARSVANMAAAGTPQRFRMEVDADGAFRVFINKALVYTGATGALDVDEELNPIVYVSPTTTTHAEMDVLDFQFYMGEAA